MVDRVEFTMGQIKIHASQDAIWSQNFSHQYRCYYNRKRSRLNELCELHGSDKGGDAKNAPYPWPAHSYADYVERHFGAFRNYIRNVFECGLGSNDPAIPSNMTKTGRPGASLRVWRDYFPNAQVYGIDIDEKIIFSEERIQTFHCDQTNSAQVQSLWKMLPDVKFDLMIDDGLHTFDAGVSLFESSIDKLASEGTYIIEDVSPRNLLLFFEYFRRSDYSFDFINLHRPGLDIKDNSLVIIRK